MRLVMQRAGLQTSRIILESTCARVMDIIYGVIGHNHCLSRIVRSTESLSRVVLALLGDPRQGLELQGLSVTGPLLDASSPSYGTSFAPVTRPPKARRRFYAVTLTKPRAIVTRIKRLASD